VAYGPEAIVLVLVAAGASALRLMLPVTLAIAGLLIVLVISYCQVIAVHPDGGGAYAVGKKDLGATVSLLAAASDARSENTFKDAEAILSEALEIQRHLQSQDTELIAALKDALSKVPAP
jgi:amino acid transporter